MKMVSSCLVSEPGLVNKSSGLVYLIKKFLDINRDGEVLVPFTYGLQVQYFLSITVRSVQNFSMLESRG